MQLKRIGQRGQSIVEYSVIIVIVMAVFLTMQHYIKRGMQGKWKSSVDDIGEQYDPRYVNGYTLYTYNSVSNSEISTKPNTSDSGSRGYWTNRVDSVQSSEKKIGVMHVGTPGCTGDNC